MKYTLLELTKRILESMESDEVSDINETPESIAVANIIKESYFDIIGQFSPAEAEGLFKLDASTDSSKPCLMYIPSIASSMTWLKYNVKDISFPSWRDLRYACQEEFFHFQSGLDPARSEIDQMDVEINGKLFKFHIKTNSFPTYYTVFDDQYVVFDSYDSSVETTLTEARTTAFGPLDVGFVFENDFVPDLDPRQFQLLLQEAKSTAFVELKQSSNPRAEAKARRNSILTQKNKYDNNPTSSIQRRYQFGRRGSNVGTIRRAMRRGS